MAPFSSDMGVTAFESSAYGKCSCASKYVDNTNGFLSPKRLPFLNVNWWLPLEPLLMLNGEPGRLRLACKLGDCYNRGGSAQCKCVLVVWFVGQQNVVWHWQGEQFLCEFALVPCLLLQGLDSGLALVSVKQKIYNINVAAVVCIVWKWEYIYNIYSEFYIWESAEAAAEIRNINQIIKPIEWKGIISMCQLSEEQFDGCGSQLNLQWLKLQ